MLFWYETRELQLHRCEIQQSVSTNKWPAITGTKLHCNQWIQHNDKIHKNHQQWQQPFYGPLSGTSWVSQYQKKHSPTHSHLSDHQRSFYQLAPSITIHSILLVQFTWLTVFCTTSLQVLFGLPLRLEHSTSYSIHFFTLSLSSFRNTSLPLNGILICSVVFPQLIL